MLICVRLRSGSKHCGRNKCIDKCMDLTLLFSQALNISFNYFLFHFSTVSGLDHFNSLQGSFENPSLQDFKRSAVALAAFQVLILPAINPSPGPLKSFLGVQAPASYLFHFFRVEFQVAGEFPIQISIPAPSLGLTE